MACSQLVEDTPQKFACFGHTRRILLPLSGFKTVGVMPRWRAKVAKPGLDSIQPRFLFCAKSVTVFVRHSTNCNDRHRGGSWRKCRCPKPLLIYVGHGSEKNRRVSAKARSWERAEQQAQALRGSWGESKTQAFADRKRTAACTTGRGGRVIFADQITRLGDNSTVQNSRSLFGHINPETKTVTRAGRLFRWVEKYNADRPADRRITYISDRTSTHLTEWRAAWGGNSEVTNHQRWRRVRGFFNFCKAQGWIDNNPTSGIANVKVAKGNRTAIFTDQQYAQILKAIPLYPPENVPDVTRTAWRRRLMVFTELLRWTGMAPVDTVLFSPSLVDA